MNRLTGVNYGDGYSQSYTFDPMGNRLTMTDAQQHVSTYNNANMLLTLDGNPYTNDINGNTLSGGGRANTWDSQNRLRQCVYGTTVSQFTYGSDGLRRASNVNGVIHKYMLDNGMMVRETDANGVSQATYLAGLRGPEYRRDDVNGGIKWYVFNGLGSVLAEVDAYGAVTASRKLDVYGAPRATQGTPSGKHAFVGNLGHTTEPDTGGLVYMRARWMDPVTGRFLSEDPARDGANWFGYCGGDPVNAVDRDGRVTEAFGWMIVFLVIGWSSNIGLHPKLSAVLQFISVSREAQLLLEMAGAMQTELRMLRSAVAAGALLDPKGAADLQLKLDACNMAAVAAFTLAAYQILILFEFVQPGDGPLGMGSNGPLTSGG